MHIYICLCLLLFTCKEELLWKNICDCVSHKTIRHDINQQQILCTGYQVVKKEICWSI